MALVNGVRHELCEYCGQQIDVVPIKVDETKETHQYVANGFCKSYCEVRFKQNQQNQQSAENANG